MKPEEREPLTFKEGSDSVHRHETLDSMKARIERHKKERIIVPLGTRVWLVTYNLVKCNVIFRAVS